MDHRIERLLGISELLIVLAPTLRLSQLKLLLLLEKHQPITQTELSLLTGLTQGAISRAFANFELPSFGSSFLW